jgi:hypothetical protein
MENKNNQCKERKDFFNAIERKRTIERTLSAY